MSKQACEAFVQSPLSNISLRPAAASASVTRILCLGDVVGRPGREALRKRLPSLRSSLGLDMIIVNGENAAGGIGLTPATLGELLAAGADVVTSGNHIWKHKEIRPHLDSNPRLLRPANYGLASGSRIPGRGFGMYDIPGGGRLAVINLLGRTFMESVDCPFAAADHILERLQVLAATDGNHAGGGASGLCVIVDFHAEASSEKRAMAHYLDGRVSAVLGTHTHVQTADAFVSPLGTASLTDLGMCGVERESVIGMAAPPVLKRFVTGLPQAFKPAKGEASLNGALLEMDKFSGKALSISLVRDKAPAVIAE